MFTCIIIYKKNKMAKNSSTDIATSDVLRSLQLEELSSVWIQYSANFLNNDATIKLKQSNFVDNSTQTLILDLHQFSELMFQLHSIEHQLLGVKKDAKNNELASSSLKELKNNFV